ncbi:hypothetical protein SAMN05660284_01445 [Formivibrio citricus]|uniref:UPF0125 protein SAMN05660284_01445 n=1 Tax=Formivibrio citricus TaxID=83765 RepID=A0A1I4YXU9_9NEIS|nr:RnfH family protein [Formivibrio citricus]SFN42509.1 hypothetical protein SAMN05660284_01445 [Formivibrio citricus]
MSLSVSVACVEAFRQVWVKLELEEGATVADAIARARLEKTIPGFTLEGHRFGIFGKAATAETELKPGDRVEVVRPIVCDPEMVPRRPGSEEE